MQKIKITSFKSGSATVFIDIIESSRLHIVSVVEHPKGESANDLVYAVSNDNSGYASQGDKYLYEDIYFMHVLGLNLYNEVLSTAWYSFQPTKYKTIPIYPGERVE